MDLIVFAKAFTYQKRMRRVLILIAFLCLQSIAFGCAVINPALITARSFIDGESAVILWDSQTHTEHFIRQAGFSTSATQLGFLVPVPSVPELAEADPKIFEMAVQVSGPRHIPAIRYLHTFPAAIASLAPLVVIALGSHVTSVFSVINSQLMVAQESSATVVATQDVAGYHATVLEADRVDQIEQWCKDNKFAWQPADAKWLDPYVRKHWKITAFQLINTTPGEGFESRLVRMSFKTDQPFYPYSEPEVPAESAPSYRDFQVSILSDTFITGKLEEGLAWPADASFFGPSKPDPTITDQWHLEDWAHLAALPAGTQMPACMSTYVDHSTIRPGHSDIIFSAAPSVQPYRQKITDTSLPPDFRVSTLDALGLAIAGLIFFFVAYGSLRAIQIDFAMMAVSDLSQVAPRSAIIMRLDFVARVVIMIFGFLFSSSLFFLPILFFMKVSNLLCYPKFQGRPRGFLRPRYGLSGKFSAIWVFLSACLYLLLVLTISKTIGEQSPDDSVVSYEASEH